MLNSHPKYAKYFTFDSPIGHQTLDDQGSPISGVRIDPCEAYDKTCSLLQCYITQHDEKAWHQITSKINYIYEHLDYALGQLEHETSFAANLHAELNKGKKLLFKPNLVSPSTIDNVTKGAGPGAPICTEWTFTAALMRWFHDKLSIKYSQMSLGEASTSTFLLASIYSQQLHTNITTEAVIEGRSGGFYGGWGFFFVRQYLSECHPKNHLDDPMNGYEESVKGIYLPPGKAGNRLMVYDLNKVDFSTGRTLSVPDGINFSTITIHKAVVGGDPDQPEDMALYPGCILINLPKLKMHAQDLITNAIKNLGIGLYPGKSAEPAPAPKDTWKYAYPSTPNPTLKGKLPHSPWVMPLDEKTLLPLHDEKGDILTLKTGGFSGTQTDILKALQSQNIMMLHIADAINIINISHNPDYKSVKVPEGYIFASLDCVALDLFCARYCFNTIPMAESIKLQAAHNYPTDFMRYVPTAVPCGKNITTTAGIDSPLFRYQLYAFAEKRGLGSQQYYITGWDSLTHTPLASIKGHLGRIDHSCFIELLTHTLYYNPKTFIHDLQKTAFTYAQSSDLIDATHLYQEILDLFDENKDGTIDYDEKGKGFETALLIVDACLTNLIISEPYGQLKQAFLLPAYLMKYSDSSYNPEGYSFSYERILIGDLALAYDLSQEKTVQPDYFVPHMTFGNGNWPSWLTVKHISHNNFLYGGNTLDAVTLSSCYGAAFQYADKILANGLYTQSVLSSKTSPSALTCYFKALTSGETPLDFNIYVPAGYGVLMGTKVPNVIETDDPCKLFHAYFHYADHTEIW